LVELEIKVNIAGGTTGNIKNAVNVYTTPVNGGEPSAPDATDRVTITDMPILVVKEALSEMYKPGEDVEYTISLTIPDWDYDRLRIEDVFPDELTYKGYVLEIDGLPVSADDVDEATSGAVSFIITALAGAGGKDVVLTVIFEVAGDAAGDINNVANVYLTPEDEPDSVIPDGTDNEILYAVWAEIPVINNITKTAASAGYTSGGTMNYTIRFKLPDELSAIGSIRVEDVLPVGMTFNSLVSAKIGGVNVAPTVDAAVAGKVSFILTAVQLAGNGGETVEMLIKCNIASGTTGDLTNTVNLYTTPLNGDEPNTPDATDNATVRGSTDNPWPNNTPSSGGGGTTNGYNMKIEKALAEGQPSIVNAGSEVNYVIRVTNTGNTTLKAIKVTDEIGGETHELGIISSLAPGQSQEFTFVYTVPSDAKPGEAIRNTAYAEHSNVGKKSDFADVTVSLFVDDHIWYIRGYEDNTLRPENSITRAEIAMVFFRLLKPELKDITLKVDFNDVSGEEWYGLAINTLAHYGILNGYTDGRFQPSQPITRREMAAVVSRFDRLIETNENPYLDIDRDDWAYGYILSATEKGWFGGDGNGRFRPSESMKRSEIVTVANRVLNCHILLADVPGNVHWFDDFTREHWSYANFMEAIYTHDFNRKADGINEIWKEMNDNGLNAAYNQ